MIIDKTGWLCTILHKRKCPGSVYTHTYLEEPERSLSPICLHREKGPEMAIAFEERVCPLGEFWACGKIALIPYKRMWTKPVCYLGQSRRVVVEEGGISA